MIHYDLIVIGTGSGNTIVGPAFSDWSVALVEERDFGGTCLNRGCIPSKMFIFPADLVDGAVSGPRLGARTSADGADWASVRDRVFGRLDANAAAGRSGREDESNVDVHVGSCRFVGEHSLVVDLADGGQVEISADHVVVAAGSRPVLPDFEGLDALERGRDYVTSDEVMRMPALPGRLLVLGGGYVGVELAHVFSAYGSEVVQVDAADTLVTNQDRDVAVAFTEHARRRWDVRLGTEVMRFDRTTGGIEVTLLGADGSTTTTEVDAVLVAVGRTPNSDRLDLARAGVRVDDDGLIEVDEHLRTTAEGVWALGDICSDTPLKHAANQDARVVRHNLLHPDDLVVSDHRFVPNAVFSTPQIAAVGLTESEARDRGLDVAVVTQDFGDVAYGWAMEEDTNGEPGHFVKLVADAAARTLVGAHLIGPQASILVQPLILAVAEQRPIVGLARRQYWIHPALTEVVEQALLSLEEELADRSR